MSSVPTNGRFGKPFSIYDGLVCNLWSQPPLGKGLQVFARQSTIGVSVNSTSIGRFVHGVLFPGSVLVANEYVYSIHSHEVDLAFCGNWLANQLTGVRCSTFSSICSFHSVAIMTISVLPLTSPCFLGNTSTG